MKILGRPSNGPLRPSSSAAAVSGAPAQLGDDRSIRSLKPGADILPVARSIVIFPDHRSPAAGLIGIFHGVAPDCWIGSPQPATRASRITINVPARRIA